MGQKVAKAVFLLDSRPFLNLASDTLEELWLNYNDIAEGFGLTPEEFRKICDCQGLYVTRDEVDRLFRILDSDKNGLVDAFEFLTALALASGLRAVDKIVYIFRCFDFDESGALTVDEMTLSFKAVLTGVAKLTTDEVPSDEELERMTRLAFVQADRNADHRITLAEYRIFCLDNPDVLSWLNHYGDPEDNPPPLQSGLPVRDDPWADPDESAAATPQNLQPSMPSMRVEPDSDVEEEVFRETLDRPLPEEAARNPERMESALFRDIVHASQAREGVAEPSGAVVPRQQHRHHQEQQQQQQEMSRASLARLPPLARRQEPWMDVLPSIVPSKPPAPSRALPRASATLEWIHGYRCHDARGNVRYNERGEIVFPASSVGVVLDPMTQTQRFMQDHGDGIASLAVDPEGTFVATGEIAREPAIYVWNAMQRTLGGSGGPSRSHGAQEQPDGEAGDAAQPSSSGDPSPAPRNRGKDASAPTAQTVESTVVLRGVHERGVSQLAFSPSGRLLASVGMDDRHTLVVYDWRARKPIWVGCCGEETVFGLCFADEDTIVTVGQRKIDFWDCATHTKRKGLFGRGPMVVKQDLLCVGAMGEGADRVIVTGTASGHVYVWKNRNCVRAFHAHEGAILALWATPVGLATGGKDGRVRLWGLDGDALATFDVSALGSFHPSVRSVMWDPAQRKLVLGTRGAEIFEISTDDGRNMHEGPLIQGHSQYELWGLASNPERDEYATVGDDGTLRVWDVAQHRLIRLARLGWPARAVTYAPDGKFLAVGLGADPEARTKALRHRSRAGLPNKDGGFLILRAHNLSVVHAGRDATDWITDLQFSPDGRTLAVASFDGKVYLYNSDDFSLRAVCTRHSSAVLHLDFSLDGSFLRSVDIDRELLFFYTENGRQQMATAAMKDVEWATVRCPTVWSTQGVTSTLIDGTEVIALDVSKAGGVAAYGDAFGRLRLVRHPCLVPDAAAFEHRTHMARVTNVRWASRDRCLVSIGGDDKCVCQWRIHGSTAARHEDDDGSETPRAEIVQDDPGALQGAESATGASSEPELDDVDLEDLRHGRDLARPPAMEDAHSTDLRAIMDKEDEAGLQVGLTDDPDESAAVSLRLAEQRPWVGQVVQPSAPPRPDSTLPDLDLQLQWVHGFRAGGSRGMVQYTRNGDIVFGGASLGVVLDPRRWEQTFFAEHTDDVVSLAVHPDGIHVATGELGLHPAIHVWRVDTMQVVSTLRGFHTRGVTQLAFSGDGERLASVGQDDDHTLAVFDWKNRAIKYTAPTSKLPCLAVSTSRDGRRTMCAGDGFLYIVDGWGRSATARPAELGVKGRWQPFLCAVHTEGGNVLVGTHDGHVYQLDTEGVLQIARKVHEGAVCAIAVAKRGEIATGGKDGFVRFWSEILEPVAEYDVGEMGSVQPSVRSLCWRAEDDRLVVGTRGAEIFEIATDDGRNMHEGPLVQGHCQHELWGLACHPVENEYATVGDDGTLRVWDADAFVAKAVVNLGGMARSVAYSPDGSLLAVGMGGRIGRGRSRDDGKWVVLQTADFRVVHRAQDSHAWITDIKFSPDGRTIGVASQDNHLYLYDVEDAFSLRGRFDRHRAGLMHFDFSADSRFIQSTCNGHELLYSDAATGAHIPSAAALKDVEWATWTCPLGWPVQGVWPPFMDGTEVHAVDRSNAKKNIIVGDNYGRFSLIRYPCLENTASRKSLFGHAATVTCVRWTAEDRYVVSLGGPDNCILQWKVVSDEAAVAALAESTIGGQEASDVDIESPVSVYTPHRSEVSHGPPLEPNGDSAIQDRPLEEWCLDPRTDRSLRPCLRGHVGGGTEQAGGHALRMKPWREAVVAPTRAPAASSQTPSRGLALEWVYGLRTFDIRSVVHFTRHGHIAFPSAGVGVVYDRAQHLQSFYQGHDDDIVSLVVDASGRFVATGQTGRRPRVHVWDAESGVLLCVLPQVHRRAIPCLDFSPDGRTLVSADDHHALPTVAVCKTASGDWTDGRLVTHSRGDPQRVLFVRHFAEPRESTARREGEFDFVTGGMHYVRFWTLEGRSLRSCRGLFGQRAVIQPILCGETVGEKLVTGTASGHLYVWDGRMITKSIPAHDPALAARSVYCMHAYPGGLATGSKDGRIRLWTPDLRLTREVDLTLLEDPPLDEAIHSISVGPARGSTDIVLVATRSAEVFELSLSTGNMTPRFEGHASGELHGLATHPTHPELAVTAGEDGTVRVWNLAGHTLLQRGTVGDPSQSVAWAPDGTLLAVGIGQIGSLHRHRRNRSDGAFALLRSDTLAVVHRAHDARKGIADAKFSPTGNLLALASRDRKLYIYDTRAGRFSLAHTLERHTAPLSHVDFSSDGVVLQAVCEGGDLLFFDPTSGRHIRSPVTTKDVEWATWTCPLGWPVQGVWPPDADGSEVHAVDRSRNQTVLVTADEMGGVKLFRYPSPFTQEAMYRRFHGHSSRVTNARFTAEDRHVITVGGANRSVFQWRVVKGLA